MPATRGAIPPGLSVDASGRDDNDDWTREGDELLGDQIVAHPGESGVRSGPVVVAPDLRLPLQEDVT